ncbi:MAG TPA: HlyD family secretion protein [Candidatus Angelobacter sp.]|nr:HlyD family secretion protein [Candidatus Angelobacter sp.]
MAGRLNPRPEIVEEPDSAPASEQEENGVSRRETARRRSRFRRPLVLIPLALLLIAGAVLLWLHFASYESTDDAQVDVHLYPVSPRISGYVIKVNAGDNQYVEQGTVLVEIDPRDYEVAVAKARADLANAEATAKSLNIAVPITSVNTSSQLKSAASDVATATSGIISAEKQLAAAHAQVEQAEANDVKAQDDLERYKRLVAKQNVSEQTYDQALASAKANTASVAAARANEAAAQQTVQQAKDKLTQAQASHRAAQTGPQQVASTNARARAAVADVEQKRASLEQAELNLQYTKIVAPVTGAVNKSVVVGMNVQTGQQLLTVVPLDEVWITANFKETQLRHMQPGQKVKVQVDSTGVTVRGHVDSIAGATGPLFSLLPPENATGNYVKVVQRIPVKIVLEPGENRDHRLRPGMNVVPKVYLR